MRKKSSAPSERRPSFLDSLRTLFEDGGEEASNKPRKIRRKMVEVEALRKATSLEAVKKGNLIMSAAMKRKQLELNVDKCCIIVFDKKNEARSKREAINKNKSVTIGENIVKAKIQDKYLGDFLNEGGLRKSVGAKISDRFYLKRKIVLVFFN